MSLRYRSSPSPRKRRRDDDEEETGNSIHPRSSSWSSFECLLDDEEDLEMLEVENDPGSSSGCTAVVALLRDRELVVANAGDSRCVVCRAGEALEMSVGSFFRSPFVSWRSPLFPSDHKPEDLEERTRIEKAGYKVTSDGRVSGGLNLSRALGDHAYKKKTSLPAEEQAITARPDVRTLTLDERDEFLVIACDGIWNFMSSQDVVDFVRMRLEKKSLRQICEEVRSFVLQRERRASLLVIHALSRSQHLWRWHRL